MTDNSSIPKRRRIKVVAMAAALVAVVGGALAFAHSGGGHHGPTGNRSPDHHLEHMQAMLTKVGASEVQKSQIVGLLKPALNELIDTHDAHYAALKQFHEGILATTIDRAQLESLRAEQVKSLDEASKRVVVALSDAAEVLTSEQRAALAREIAKHHGG